MVEGRNSQQRSRIESVHPGEIRQCVRLAVSVSKTDAWVLCLKTVRRAWRIFNVIGKGIIGNLVIIPAERSHKPKLVRRVWIEDQRSETAVAIFGVMDNLRHRRFNSQIAAICVHAGVVGESFGVAADIEFVVSLVEIAEAGDKFCLTVTLESCARNDIEYAVSAVSRFSAVTSAVNLEVVNVFRIQLRTNVRSNVGI